MEPYSLRFVPLALLELEESERYYERRRKGQGRKFRTAVFNKLTSITNMPELAPIRYKNIRCAVVHGYPYLIHYYIA